MIAIDENTPEMSDTLNQLRQLMAQMEATVVGQSNVALSLTIALLVNGNLLLEGLPGTAKTRSIKLLAEILEASLGRVQFTPDLLPSDVVGTDMYQEVEGRQQLTFEPGPVFNNLILADEINRAPAKVQSALLEAMEERQVTVGGKTYPLPALFMVLATQNPIEQEGTYPLPEAQTDRFTLKVCVNYPDDAAELDILRLVRSEEHPGTKVATVVNQDTVFAARKQVQGVFISENIEHYIVALVMATRKPERYPDSPLAQWIEVGASPRASVALDKCARAHGWLNGRDFVSPEDVRGVLYSVLRHRLILSYGAIAEGVTPEQVIDELLRQVALA